MEFGGCGGVEKSMANNLGDLEIVPNDAPVGAEVRGVDWSEPIPEGFVEVLKQVWLDHKVLLFRGRKLSDPELLAVTEVSAAAKRQSRASFT